MSMSVRPCPFRWSPSLYVFGTTFNSVINFFMSLHISRKCFRRLWHPITHAPKASKSASQSFYANDTISRNTLTRPVDGIISKQKRWKNDFVFRLFPHTMGGISPPPFRFEWPANHLLHYGMWKSWWYLIFYRITLHIWLLRLTPHHLIIIPPRPESRLYIVLGLRSVTSIFNFNIFNEWETLDSPHPIPVCILMPVNTSTIKHFHFA